MADEKTTPLFRAQNADTARAFRTVPFPGWRGKPDTEGGLGWRVGMVPLGLDQVHNAHAKAWEHFTGVRKLSQEYLDLHPEELLAERTIQELSIALRDPDNRAVPFGKASEIRALLPDEIAALYSALQRYQRDVGPITNAQTFEELEAQLDALGKGRMTADFLERYDTATLLSTITELAFRWTRLKAALTNTSSSSTPTKSESSGGSSDGSAKDGSQRSGENDE